MGIFRSIRQRRILKEHLLPPDTWRWLVEDHPILAGLTAEELATLREMSTVFLHEKAFEGADGLELDAAMREVIAVQACLPILHLGMEWYDNWKTVVVVPDVFVEEHTSFDAAGVVHEWDEDKSGESWDTGPVLLSWKDVEASGWGDGYNVIIHEAAHRLDLGDGDVNGTPALHAGMDSQEWKAVFTDAYQDLKRRARRQKRGLKIDPYAIEDAGEFPDVYRLLSAFYRQDPIRRIHAP